LTTLIGRGKGREGGSPHGLVLSREKRKKNDTANGMAGGGREMVEREKERLPATIKKEGTFGLCLFRGGEGGHSSLAP